MQSSTTTSSDAQTAALNPAEICTLSPEGLGDRLAWMRREIMPHAVEKVRLGDGLALELGEVPGLVEKIDHLIALERECCSGIVFERCTSATPGHLRLEVRGIDPDARVVQSLRVPQSPPPAGTRLAKAAGAGIVVSLFVCCVLPIAAGALLGAAAAPLSTLDGPGPIAAGALVGGAVTWRWLGHARGAKGVADPSCSPNC